MEVICDINYKENNYVMLRGVILPGRYQDKPLQFLQGEVQIAWIKNIQSINIQMAINITVSSSLQYWNIWFV